MQEDPPESEPKTVTSEQLSSETSVDEDEKSTNDRPKNIVKSLEFLKFKYGMQGREPFYPDAWLVSLSVLVTLTFLILVLAFTVASITFCERTAPCSDCYETFIRAHQSVSLVLLASIAGAYTYMVRALYQAIQNFDLEPASFFGAASNLVFGIVVTQIATFYLAKESANLATPTALLAIAAFIGAYMTDDILRYFLSLSTIRRLKEERSDFGREIESVPIEVLDGIDSKVRYRLSDFHIESVQNLASANPLMLFVETPYGFYQTLDWVAQAQLCASVGPDATFKLFKMGVRTIFDLERAILCDGFVDNDIRQAIQRVILPDLVGPTPWTPSAIKANVRMRIDGSDTRRLRQIVLRVNEQLGGAAAASFPVKEKGSRQSESD